MVWIPLDFMHFVHSKRTRVKGKADFNCLKQKMTKVTYALAVLSSGLHGNGEQLSHAAGPDLRHDSSKCLGLRFAHDILLLKYALDAHNTKKVCSFFCGLNCCFHKHSAASISGSDDIV